MYGADVFLLSQSACLLGTSIIIMSAPKSDNGYTVHVLITLYFL